MIIPFRRIKQHQGFESGPNLPMPLMLNEFCWSPLPTNAAIIVDPTAYIGWSLGQTNEEMGAFLLWMIDRVLAEDWEALRSFRFILGVNTGTIGRVAIPDSVRANVLAAGECAFCGSTEQLSIDHILAVSRGGTNDRSNLQCLCLPCNLKKGAD